MPGLLTTASTLMCPHGGTVTATTSNTRAKTAAGFLLRASDTFLVAGCPFILGLVPHPCVRVQWVQPAARGKAAGDFLLTEASVGLCIAPDSAPQGTVLVVATAPDVQGQ
jgi:hypothetical protein